MPISSFPSQSQSLSQATDNSQNQHEDIKKQFPILPLHPEYSLPHSSIKEEVRTPTIPSFYDYTRNYSIAGLENIGNSCWMNCIIQALSATLPLSNYFLSKKYSNDLIPRKYFANNYFELLKKLWGPHGGEVNPEEFLNCFCVLVPGLSQPYQQQDAHEALVYLLDLLHGELNRNYSNTYFEESPSCSAQALKLHSRHSDSFIWDLFGGQLQSEVICPNCFKKKSVTFDHFTSLSLEIMKNLDSPIPLEAILQSFTQGENFEWKCTNCNRKSPNIKRTLTISLLPNILILQLKRFSQCYLTGNQKKIEKLIHFPIDCLDMKDYMSHKEQNPGTRYKLYATLNQRGSLSCGHYTAYVKRYNKWYLCNDRVISLTKNIVPNNENYILFYVRNDLKF